MFWKMIIKGFEMDGICEALDAEMEAEDQYNDLLQCVCDIVKALAVQNKWEVTLHGMILVPYFMICTFVYGFVSFLLIVVF